jgi:hypothetical protein
MLLCNKKFWKYSVCYSEVFDDKNLVMPTSVDKNEVNMGFMPLAYPLLVIYIERPF